jgi:hypothetical protein
MLDLLSRIPDAQTLILGTDTDWFFVLILTSSREILEITPYNRPWTFFQVLTNLSFIIILSFDAAQQTELSTLRWSDSIRRPEKSISSLLFFYSSSTDQSYSRYRHAYFNLTIFFFQVCTELKEANLFIIFSGVEYHLKQSMNRLGPDFHLQDFEQAEEHSLRHRKEIKDKRRVEC